MLAAFMGGLALGSALGGRAAPRLDPAGALRGYALLELGVALTALTLAPALTLARPLLAAAYADGDGGAWFLTLRLIVSLLAVSLPATAMGATLPLAIRSLDAADVRKSIEPAGRVAGLLYAVNTFGAAMGAWVTGFMLLPAVGLSGTTWIGVAVNALVAVVAWWLAGNAQTSSQELVAEPGREAEAPSPQPSPRKRGEGAGALDQRIERRIPSPIPGERIRVRGRQHRNADPRVADRSTVSQPLPTPRPLVAALALAGSGCAALMHEVAWTRVAAMLVGPTTYAFTVMLTAFIIGLALGGAVAVRMLRYVRQPVIALAVAQVLAAAGAIGAAVYVPRLPAIVTSIVHAPERGYFTVLAFGSLLILALLLPLTLALGASFPFAVQAAAPGRRDAARPAALVFASNTIGAIAGALLGGFVCLPMLGLHRTVMAAAIVSALVAACVALSSRARIFAPTGAGLALALVVLTFNVRAWNPGVLAAGVYRRGSGAVTDPVIDEHAGSLLYYGDGAVGTVSVRRVAGDVSLAINGKVDASNGADMLTQQLLAHLPLLLHPSPQDVCIIGLGSGVTASSALAHPVRRVDSVELSPEVVAAPAFFKQENRDTLRDPRSRLIVGDGRSHMRFTSRQYDVVISEPSNPWIAGIAPLFTREFFEAVRERPAGRHLLPVGAHLSDERRGPAVRRRHLPARISRRQSVAGRRGGRAVDRPARRRPHAPSGGAGVALGKGRRRGGPGARERPRPVQPARAVRCRRQSAPQVRRARGRADRR